MGKSISYIIPRAVYQSSNVPNQPYFDPLIGVCNPYDTAQSVELHFYDMVGAEVPNSPLIRTLEPGHSFATTLIPNNIFPLPPNDFQGYAEIVLPSPALMLPVAAALGGNGPTPLNWNYASYELPVHGITLSRHGVMRRAVFPYAIPFFTDLDQHFGTHAYRTGLAITNMGDKSVEISLTYTVGDTYPQQGQQFNVLRTIAPHAQFAIQLHELFPQLSSFNSEGWLDMHSTGGVMDLVAYILPANMSYQYFGFGYAPFVIE